MAKKKTHDDILRAPDKLASETHGVTGILAGLYRQVMAARGVDLGSWGRYMYRHLTDPRNNVLNSRKDMTNTRGNIAKELLNDEMTFKVFCKGIVFLRLRKVRFYVEWEDPHTKRRVNVSIPVNFGEDSTEDSPEGEVEHNERPIQKGPRPVPSDTERKAREGANER